MKLFRPSCTYLLVLTLILVACTTTRPVRIIEMQPEVEDEPTVSDQRRTNLAHVASTADIQAALAESGVKIAVDGKMGPGTKSALREFQQKNGLKVTGIADAPTLTKLGL